MKIDKQTGIVIAVSAGVGFLFDVITYSIGESKGKSFKIHMPKGKALIQILALGILGGAIVDTAIKGISDSMKAAEELKLDKLVAEEVERIRSGQIKGQTPEKIVWTDKA